MLLLQKQDVICFKKLLITQKTHIINGY